MGLIRTSSLLVLFVSSCLATYGHHGGYGKGSSHSKDIHLDSSTIHLDSPKIVVDRPRIHIKDDDSGHGHVAVHSTPKAVAPIIINGGHGGYGAHGGYEGHGGKVHVAGPIVVAPAPVVHHAGPILVRRPVTVHKDLIPTQDHLENLHHFGGLGGLHHGGYISAGHGLGHGIGGYHGGYYGAGHAHGAGHAYGHGGYVQAVPIGKGVPEKGLVYERPLTNLGHGLISFSAYHQPATPVIVAQPRPIYGGHIHAGGLHGGHIHAGGLYGSGISFGKDIHGGIHGGDVHGAYKKY